MRGRRTQLNTYERNEINDWITELRGEIASLKNRIAALEEGESLQEQTYTHVAIIETWARDGAMETPAFRALHLIGETVTQSVSVLVFASKKLGQEEASALYLTPGVTHFEANNK
jgi:hypothetical protein